MDWTNTTPQRFVPFSCFWALQMWCNRLINCPTVCMTNTVWEDGVSLNLGFLVISLNTWTGMCMRENLHNTSWEQYQATPPLTGLISLDPVLLMEGHLSMPMCSIGDGPSRRHGRRDARGGRLDGGQQARDGDPCAGRRKPDGELVLRNKQ